MGLTADRANALVNDPAYQTVEESLELIRLRLIDTPADRPGALTPLYSARTSQSIGARASTADAADYVKGRYSNEERSLN
jgi:hypothetical protein